MIVAAVAVAAGRGRNAPKSHRVLHRHFHHHRLGDRQDAAAALAGAAVANDH